MRRRVSAPKHEQETGQSEYPEEHEGGHRRAKPNAGGPGNAPRMPREGDCGGGVDHREARGQRNEPNQQGPLGDGDSPAHELHRRGDCRGPREIRGISGRQSTPRHERLGVDDELVARLRAALASDGPAAAGRLVPDSVLGAFAITGDRARVAGMVWQPAQWRSNSAASALASGACAFAALGRSAKPRTAAAASRNGRRRRRQRNRIRRKA